MDFMKYAIELAKKGTGAVNPNPLVGAVIVKNDRIIGEGWHEKYGGPHAEVNAFANATENVAGADMYVTLEPCSHFGNTPPCAHSIVKHGIKRVFIGMKDPNPLVCGKGIKILEKAGIEVICGIRENECKRLNSVFIKYITTKKPFVVMKYAMSLDGKIAAYTGKSKWISSEGSRILVQQMRNNLMSIMVGINTVLKDNPRLNCRIEGGRNPIKIVVDSKLRIPENAELLNDLKEGGCIIAVSSQYDRKKAERLLKKGVKIIEAPDKSEKVDLNFLMTELGKLKIDGILLEGGGSLNFSALDAGIVDMAVGFISPLILGGAAALTPVEGLGFESPDTSIHLTDVHISEYMGDCLIYGNIERSK